MKKILLIAILCLTSQMCMAQAKGTRTGFIDMEYILSKLPNYNEALNSLERSAGDWKAEIDKKNDEIKLLKDALNTERVLLTKDLIAEREEEIKFLNDELIEYQQKKFGPEGDLIIMRSTLVKPVQDMVFSIIQDIAVKRNYDFILDKSSDMTVLFSKKNLDLSDFVVRAINRSLKGEKLSKKELEKIEKEEEDLLKVKSPQQEERDRRLEDKKLERERLIEERKAAKDAKIAEAQARRNKTTVPKAANQQTGEGEKEAGETNVERLKREADERREVKRQENEDRKREAAERRQQMIEDKNKPKTTTIENPKAKSGTDFENSAIEDNETPDGGDKAETPKERARRLQLEKIEQRKQEIEQRKQEAKDKRDALIKAKEDKKNE